MKKTIRPIAVSIFKRDDEILVGEGYDRVKDEVFYRPFGGAIEFGEHSKEAVIREIREELDAEITDLKYLGTVENIFIHNGEKGHEIVIIYKGKFSDSEMYEKNCFDVYDDGNFCWKALWKPLPDFLDKGHRLYPDGLMELIESNL